MARFASWTRIGRIRGRISPQPCSQLLRGVSLALYIDTILRCSDSQTHNRSANQCFHRFVCANSRGHRDLDVQFTTYRRIGEADRELFDNAKIWEACRATSAATTFFSPIRIGRNNQEFVDGATSANNPIRKLWKEARGVWGTQGQFEPRVQCVVSIGTGMPSVEPFGDDPLSIARTLLHIATETETTAAEFAQEHEELEDRNGLYRLNVLQGLQGVGLEDAGSRSRIADATMAYGQREMQRALRNFKRTVSDFSGV